jgi:hypothetical protein
MNAVAHVCASDCECRVDLNAASECLQVPSGLLSLSSLSGLDDSIEARYAAVKCATAKLAGAFGAYLSANSRFRRAACSIWSSLCSASVGGRFL